MKRVTFVVGEACLNKTAKNPSSDDSPGREQREVVLQARHEAGRREAVLAAAGDEAPLSAWERPGQLWKEKGDYVAREKASEDPPTHGWWLPRWTVRLWSRPCCVVPRMAPGTRTARVGGGFTLRTRK